MMIGMGHQHLVAILIGVVNFASAVQLLLYCRNGTRFRRRMSWLVDLLLVGRGVCSLPRHPRGGGREEYRS